jgi:hypothetical protein
MQSWCLRQTVKVQITNPEVCNLFSSTSTCQHQQTPVKTVKTKSEDVLPLMLGWKDSRPPQTECAHYICLIFYGTLTISHITLARSRCLWDREYSKKAGNSSIQYNTNGSAERRNWDWHWMNQISQDGRVVTRGAYYKLRFTLCFSFWLSICCSKILVQKSRMGRPGFKFMKSRRLTQLTHKHQNQLKIYI